jgi:hypothetical protein
MNLFIRFANMLLSRVSWFAQVSALIGLLPLLIRRFGPACCWEFEQLIAAALVAGTGGCGLSLAMPQAWPWAALCLGWAWAAVNAAAASWFLVLAARARRCGSHRLRHGMPVDEAGPNVTAGRVEPGISTGAPLRGDISSSRAEEASSLLDQNIPRTKGLDSVCIHERTQILVFNYRRFTHDTGK